MRLPRDLSGADLIQRLGRLGYIASRTAAAELSFQLFPGKALHPILLEVRKPTLQLCALWRAQRHVRLLEAVPQITDESEPLTGA